MLYCTKCRGLCEDTSAKCPHCKNSRSLRSAHEDDLVLLQRADAYTAQQISSALKEHGISCQLEKFGTGRVSYLYDSEVMPTDQNLYVRFGDLPTATGLSAFVQRQIEAQRKEGFEPQEEMSKGKRMLVQSLSVIAFMILVMLTVFGADAFAGWLKSLFGG